MHENLIDQTHFPFLHPDTVGTQEYARSKLTASTENNQVVSRRELKNARPPGVHGKPATRPRSIQLSPGWINEVVQNDGETQFDLSFAPDKPGLMARRIIYRLAMKEAR